MKGLTGHAARRGAIVATAYLSTSVITLAVLYLFARHGDALLLRSLLGIQFIAFLAAGLEPATAKAMALNQTDFVAGVVPVRSILAASTLKAVAASPALAFVWRLSDPSAGWALLACTPLVCIAGFAATDLRVLFDLRGRHAEAIWLKQGTLGGGFALLAVLAFYGMSIPAALCVASVVRAAVVALAAGALRKSGRGTHIGLGGMLRDPKWLSLAGASVVAAIGGSADRVFGLRYLSAEAWAGYYALYEVFSRFWFIPYVAAPIVFARAASGLDSEAVGRFAWRLTAGAGAIFVAAVGAALLIAPDLPSRLLGARLGVGLSPLAIVAFAAAVAVSGLAQIRIAKLQGEGAVHRGLAIMATSAAITTALFFAVARSARADGLLYAWLAKSAIDVGLTYASPFSRRRTSRA